MITSAFFGFSKNIIFSKFLDVTAFGYYSLFILVSSYGMYFCHFGISDGALRELSIFRGRNEQQNAIEIRNNALGGILTISTITFMIYVSSLIFIINIGKLNRDITYVLLMAGLYSVGNTLFSFGTLDLRTSLRTVTFSLMLLLKAFFSLIIGLLAIHFLGWKSMIVVEVFVVTSLFFVIVAVCLKNVKFKLRSLFKIKLLIKIGLPITIGNFIKNITISIDRWFVVFIFGITVFSQYAFGMLITTGGMILTNILSVYLGPRFLHEFGRTKDLDQMKKQIGYITLTISLLFIFAYFPFIFLIERLGEIYFSNYSQGLDLMKLIYIGIMFQTMNMFDWIFIAANKTDILPKISFSIAFLILTLCALVSIFNSTLTGFALIYSFGRVSHFFLSAFLSFKCYSRKELLR